MKTFQFSIVVRSKSPYARDLLRDACYSNYKMPVDGYLVTADWSVQPPAGFQCTHFMSKRMSAFQIQKIRQSKFYCAVSWSVFRLWP